MWSSEVSEASNDSLPFWSVAVNPGVLVGTTKPRMDFTSPGSPVWAHTTATSAMDPLVIHIFVPFRTHPPSTFFAVVIMPAGLDP